MDQRVATLEHICMKILTDKGLHSLAVVKNILPEELYDKFSRYYHQRFTRIHGMTTVKMILEIDVITEINEGFPACDYSTGILSRERKKCKVDTSFTYPWKEKSCSMDIVQLLQEIIDEDNTYHDVEGKPLSRFLCIGTPTIFDQKYIQIPITKKDVIILHQ